MAQVGFHHANILAKQLSNSVEHQLTSRNSELLVILQNIPSLESVSTDSTSSEEELPQQHEANATPLTRFS